VTIYKCILNYFERSLLLALLQDKGDFELSTLPALVPVFTSASGETLLLLVKHADLIINKVISVTLQNINVFFYSFVISSIILYDCMEW
jgi:hypothetical protein